MIWSRSIAKSGDPVFHGQVLKSEIRGPLFRTAHWHPSLTWALTHTLNSRDMPDPTTQSNYLQVYTTNVDFDWNLDFVNQIVEGAAKHTVLAKEAGVEEIMYMNHH